MNKDEALELALEALEVGNTTGCKWRLIKGSTRPLLP